MKGFLVVLVTCPTRRHAQHLAKTLVSKRLAACVNIVGQVESFFWWKGKVAQAHETLLMIKTGAQAFDRLKQLVCALHPYEIPEVIAVPIQTAHRPYLRWLRASLTSR